MLPSTGLFKSFSCPYYDGTNTGCLRPYCHFKHVRKDETEAPTEAPAVPVYIPAPKFLTLPDITYVSKKKNNLEYQPEKPALDASSSKKQPVDDESSAPVYIPAPASQCNGAAMLDLDDCEDELNELSDIFDEQMLRDDKDSNECRFGEGEESKETQVFVAADIKKEIKNEFIELDGYKQKVIKQEIEEKELKNEEEKSKKSSSKESSHRRSIERQDSTASTSSGSKHKHKSSSKTKDTHNSEEKKSNRDEYEKHDRDKEKERHKDKSKDSERHRSSSSSSTKKHKSESNKTTTRDKEKSSNDKMLETKHKSSSSSSTRKHHHSSASSKHKISSVSAKKPKLDEKHSVEGQSSSSTTADIEAALSFATSEEDIMKECEMIYDQLEEKFATLHQNVANDEENQQKIKEDLKRKSEEEIDAAAAAMQKKRVAFENAESEKRHALTFKSKPNHIRNAMQAIYERQNAVRRQEEEDAAASEAALRDAEEKVREANEALRKAKEKNLTPLVPKTYLMPPTRFYSRTIAPVANMLALERAKKKVEELRAEKQPAFTPAQSVKNATRVAHKATAAKTAVVEPEKKPKPPVLEANSTKISFNIRMQYYEMMVKHAMAIYHNAPDAWERAQMEELAVLKKCNTPIIYKSSAMLTINKLRKEAADSGNKPAASKIISHEVVLAGKLARNATSWSVQKKIKSDASVSGEPFDKLPGEKAFDMVYALRLNEDQLVANGFPRAGKRPGAAVATYMRPMRRPNETERYCSRCGKVFNLDIYDEVCVDQCNYHPKGTGYRRGFADNQHRCCQQPAGTPGCSYAHYHVTDYVDVDNLTGFVTTMDKPDDYVSTKKDIYALDCEMCYTTEGIELTRVTVVDINSRTVYDALVKPDNKIVDYNTIYSGITEQMLCNETRTLRDVQAILLSMFHSKTVLVGHSLDSDLKALKMIHGVVVDTSVLFPHKMGPPKKRALKTLCVENLKRIIQENEAGHDSAEDAEVCIQLVKFYLRNKIS